jgi:hypothetical protein
MPFKGYGKWSAEECRQAIFGLSPAVDTIDFLLESLDENPKVFANFVEIYEAFILDDSMSFAQKADEFLEDPMDEQSARDYFKHCWELLLPERPWPIKDDAKQETD